MLHCSRLLFTTAPILPLRRIACRRSRRVLPTHRTIAYATSSSPAGRALVIVESPAKATTIQKFLPPDEFEVRSCVGHIRELPTSAKRIPAKYKGEPWARLGVNVSAGFRPIYVLIEGKRKVISELREELRSKSELILATDEDREGEAISWHLVEVLKPTVPVRRAVFHEITEDAIQKGIENSRDIDLCLVQAQETRRVLDRLAGYTMSPLLWRKIARGLSAGRVQSVAMALIVRRELARLRFVPSDYVSCNAFFTGLDPNEGKIFEATLVAVDGVRLAKRTDFDGETGNLKEGTKPGSFWWYSESDLCAILKDINGASAEVSAVERRRSRRNPPVPFITSTLQQECGNKLGMGAGRTMRTAQKLYENGFITYHRTDNPSISEQAVSAARKAVEKLYGTEFLGDAESAEKKSSLKTPKGAQAAHEAIRPAGVKFVHPNNTNLDADEYRIYELIFQRTLASQMAPAAVDTTSIKLEARSPETSARKLLSFRATGSTIVFPGYLLATKGSEAESSTSQFLPSVSQAEVFSVSNSTVSTHTTKPPMRYNDASIVKALEELGVGRPSTYASIIEKLIERGYVYRGKELGEHKGVPRQALVPSLPAFAVERLLSTHFPSFVDAEFTAQMESTLDNIAAGNADRLEYLTNYYSGENGLAASVERREKDIDPTAFRQIILPNLPPAMCGNDGVNSPSKRKGNPGAKRRARVKVKESQEEKLDWSSTKLLVNSYGPYIERDGAVIAGLPKETLAEELNEECIENFIRISQNPPVLGVHPETGEAIVLKTSSYGPYVQLGHDTDRPAGEKPKRQGLLPGMAVEDVDVETAIKLLELPRIVGVHPRTGAEVRVAQGPYGPYIAHDGTNVALRKGYDVLSVGIEECLIILEEAEERKRKREEKQAGKLVAVADVELTKSKTKSKKAGPKKRMGTKENGRQKLKKATAVAQ